MKISRNDLDNIEFIFKELEKYFDIYGNGSMKAYLAVKACSASYTCLMHELCDLNMLNNIDTKI